VHFLYGVLLMPATVEMLRAKASSRGVWAILLPVALVMSHSVVYEMVEWLAAAAFGGDPGAACLGAQGDSRDAQKDMALATAGALLARLALRVAGFDREPVA
jgi:putative membrane protein